jgi:membrane fusion protein (multidrug efflux system)
MAGQIEAEPGMETPARGNPAVPQPPQPEVRRRSPEPPPVRRSFLRAHAVALVIGAIVLVILAIGGVWLWNYLSSFESTDDAQIDGHIYPISPRVSGRVIAVNADANQSVKAGQVLVRLDPTDYKVALERAKADLAQAQADARAALTQVPITTTTTSSQTATAGAGVVEAQAGVATAERQYEAAQARIREAEANYDKALKDVERFRPLVAKEEISRQQFDQAVATAAAMGAMVDTARANAEAAQRQVAQARARVTQAEAQQAGTRSAPQEIASQRARASSEEAKAQSERSNVQQAELNAQYTIVVSPIDGVVGRRSVEVGQQVQAGQDLMSVVSLNDLWVTANYKETQLRRMRVGQPVTVHVDALDRDYKAHIDSFPGATGARFSLLPPENATGNYVKVVQRLPVKIFFDSGQDTARMLRPGMSVETKVWITK